ncbi:hypothetical protein RIF29_20971 [Crotalaria pallida]|uniref:RRM domain-containing protein n=1 Tax=Crotalaria pallida TaxID=3830 RepID=A0AAN9F6K6_CROPI
MDSGLASGATNENKDMIIHHRHAGIKMIMMICLCVITVIAFCVFLFKLWQKKRRGEKHAPLLKHFEDDDNDDAELELQKPFSAISVMPDQALTQQATLHARKVYVGGLPPTANKQSVATYFSKVMAKIGGNTVGQGDAVVDVNINHDKKFALVEMRSVEEASNAMALDGIIFEGTPVKVTRPTDYNPSLASTLGPTRPNPSLNLAAVGLIPGSAGGLEEDLDCIVVGGFPYYYTENQIIEFLEAFGPLRSFDLAKDSETGNSKGYAFCVYQDPAVANIVCAALTGIRMGARTLTVRHVNQDANQRKPQEFLILPNSQ